MIIKAEIEVPKIYETYGDPFIKHLRENLVSKLMERVDKLLVVKETPKNRSFHCGYEESTLYETGMHVLTEKQMEQALLGLKILDEKTFGAFGEEIRAIVKNITGLP